MEPKLHEIHKQHTFDSYCKSVLTHEACNGHREINRRERMEISISNIPEETIDQLTVYDKFPWDYTSFKVGNEIIIIESDILAEELKSLPDKERSILLMYYFLDMTDSDIANFLGMARRTVNRYRQNAYRMLKKLMRGAEDNE